MVCKCKVDPEESLTTSAECCSNEPLTVLVKYHFPDLPEIEEIAEGDWIDLRAAEEVTLMQWEYYTVSLGISMEIPEGYELHLAPRSSTFKNFGVIQTNSVGVIDRSYSSDKDIIKMPVLAIRDTKINFGDRICQFRILPKQPKLNLVKVDKLNNKERGGFGSTGINTFEKPTKD